MGSLNINSHFAVFGMFYLCLVLFDDGALVSLGGIVSDPGPTGSVVLRRMYMPYGWKSPTLTQRLLNAKNAHNSVQSVQLLSLVTEC